MKRFILLLTLLQAVLLIQAQSLVYDTIQINNISARFASNGIISYNNASAGFSIPKDSGTHALFAGGLWIGGHNIATQQLHFSNIMYNDVFTNFRFGPIGNTYDSTYNNRYNRLWKVTQQQIDFHKANYNSSSYNPPVDITTWPGNGITQNGEPLLLAPFDDKNGNLLYEPQLGETPDIRGDEALYIIYSDRANLDDSVYGKSLGIDIHLMVYAYSTLTKPYLNNTILLHYNIVNRSNNNYQDVVIGHWNDFELGCFNNDRIGCDTVSNSFYVYNGSAIDNDCQGVKGYGNVRPALGLVFLNHPISSNMAYSSYSTTSGFPPVDLNSAEKLYDLMNAVWADGTHLTYGGNGHLGDVETKFHSLQNPCDTIVWSNVSAGGPALPPGDVKAIGSIGPFYMPHSSNLCVDLAYVFATGSPQTACIYDVIDSLKYRISQIRTEYNLAIKTCYDFSTNVFLNQNDATRVYPNPGVNNIMVENNASLIKQIVISDLRGKIVYGLGGINSKSHSIDITNFGKGVYVLSIQTKDGISSKKLVIE